MLLQNYCITAGLSIIFLIGCLLHLYENDVFTPAVNRKFHRLIYVIIFDILLDTAFELLEGQPITAILYILKSVELAINPMMAFLVFDIFYDKKTSGQNNIIKRIRIIIFAVSIINMVLLIVNIFNKYFFYLDQNNFYHRGNSIFLYVAILIFIFFLVIYGTIIFSGKTQSIMRATLLSFMLVLNAGILLRAIFRNSNYDFLCISVAILLLLVYYAHIMLRTDPLTQLLNRHVYSAMLEKIDYTTIIIMIDANNFKQINDTYGHECGDRAIKKLAHLIYKAYGEYAYCFRLGGDEFCVILKPNVFDKLIETTPYYDTYAVAENLMKRLDELLLAPPKTLTITV